MTADALDLLTSPVIRAIISGAPATLSLPQLYAALMADAVDSLPGLRPHQRAAWHMLLAQIGALALHRSGLSVPPGDAPAWHGVLRALTPGEEATAWSLAVEDVSRPAFLQPPAPEGGMAAFRNAIPTPDALDVLITAKNFDIKSAVAAEAEADEWLFALVSLQTMEGFLGAGNYGIARMNGGFSARPFLGLAPPGGMGAHLRRDMAAMLAARARQLDLNNYYPEEDGLALTWLRPWDGASSLSIAELDLWFVEVCRRVRLVASPGGRLSARGVGTAAPRIQAKELNGVTGDFWAPVNIAEGKSFTLDSRGFSAAVLTRLLFGNAGKRVFDWPPALRPMPGESGEMRLVARGIARGQGKTEGWHERIIPFHGPAMRAMASEEGRQALGAIADLQQKETARIASALRLGCAIVSRGGQDGDKDKKDAAAPYLRRLDLAMEAGFFAALQDRHAKGDAAKAPYLRELVGLARVLLHEAAATIPCAAIRRHRARVAATGAFHAMLWGEKSPLANDKALILGEVDAA